MRVCVTGGTGFLGAALVQDLLAREVPVRVLARPSRRADALESQGAEVVRGDLADVDCITRAVQGADVVYHLAAKVDTPGSRADFLEANVAGTERVLNACLKRALAASCMPVRWRYMAWRQTVGRSMRTLPATSRRSCATSTLNRRSWLSNWSSASRGKRLLPITIVRPGIVYGPGRPLPVALLGFTLAKTNFVFGNPKHRIPLNYVENLVDAMQMAAQSGGGRLEQFNIVDDDELTLAKYHAAKTAVDKTATHFLPGWPVRLAGPFAEIAVRLLPVGGSVRFSKHQIERALQDRWHDTQRIRQATGWSPKVPLDEALHRTWKAGR